MTKSIKQLAEEWMKDMEFKLAYSQADAVSKFASYLDSYLDSSYTLLEKSKTVDLRVKEKCEHRWWDLKVMGLSQCSRCKTIKSTYEIAIMAGAPPKPSKCEHEWSREIRASIYESYASSCKLCGQIKFRTPKPSPDLPELPTTKFLETKGRVCEEDCNHISCYLIKIIHYLKVRE